MKETPKEDIILITFGSGLTVSSAIECVNCGSAKGDSIRITNYCDQCSSQVFSAISESGLKTNEIIKRIKESNDN